tara:strand:- start:294 stop:959 length:666 start_codon:yes stop_codon:yes gene_type:complete
MTNTNDVKRILITGMSRAGTSFTHTLFWDVVGKFTTHQKMSVQDNGFFRLTEPSCFNYVVPVSDPDIGIDLIKQIQIFQQEYLLEEDGHPLVVVKHHLLMEAPVEFYDIFDKVLVCVRAPNSWLRSAKKFEPTNIQMQEFEEHTGIPAEDHGKYLYEQAMSLLERVPHSEVLDFHDTEGNIQKLKGIMSHSNPSDVEAKFRETWLGSSVEGWKFKNGCYRW